MQIDKLIGQRVRTYRNEKGLKLSELAQALGISVEQMQAYETGARRILPSQLWHIADLLGISVVRLFQNKPSKDDEVKEMQEMLDQFDTLPASQKSRVILQMRALSCPEMKPLPPPANKRPQ